MNFPHTATLGAGVIGASWTALFLASGRTVAVYDPSPDAMGSVRRYIDEAWPILTKLGLTDDGNPDAVTFHTSVQDAVDGADFIQESVPERLPIKHELYQSIESQLSPKAIVASSASGLMLSEMQKGWKNPLRFVLGHPFNPPHLIPLVELMENDLTEHGVIENAEAFYQSLGKVTIRVNREVPGHVANRLQAAVWREAIHMVATGVASVEDVDKAMWAGPGLRWAAMGPTMLFHLGAGEGGLADFCERYSDSFNRWWDDLGDIKLTSDLAEQLVKGIEAAANGHSVQDLSEKRDSLLTAMQIASNEIRKRD